jgi:hypothetical protein
LCISKDQYGWFFVFTEKKSSLSPTLDSCNHFNSKNSIEIDEKHFNDTFKIKVKRETQTLPSDSIKFLSKSDTRLENGENYQYYSFYVCRQSELDSIDSFSYRRNLNIQSFKIIEDILKEKGSPK